jgi:4-hydroxy-tetrahydrodipicolinate synthase
MLYNISSTTHMTIPLEVVEALSQNRQVVGIKDSDNNLPRLQALIEKLGRRPDFSILVGVTALAAQMLMLGADGLVPSPGNLVPDICQCLYESTRRGDRDAALVCQRRLDEVSMLFRNGRTLAQSLGLLKAAMGALSLCGPDVLPPLPTPSTRDQDAVRRAFLEWQAEVSRLSPAFTHDHLSRL